MSRGSESGTPRWSINLMRSLRAAILVCNARTRSLHAWTRTYGMEIEFGKGSAANDIKRKQNAM